MSVPMVLCQVAEVGAGRGDQPEGEIFITQELAGFAVRMRCLWTSQNWPYDHARAFPHTFNPVVSKADAFFEFTTSSQVTTSPPR